MRAARFIPFLLILAACFSARAQETPVLLNYEQVMELSTSVRADYIRAIRLALVDLEMDQRKDESALNWLSVFPQAFAADINDQCVFAGWIGTFTAPVDGHRYCHAPTESLSGCEAGDIKCNPAIFGDNLCVKKDTFATSSCDTRAPDSKIIATTYLSNAAMKKNWEQLAGSIDSICAVTTRQQIPCAKIKKRLDAVEKRTPLPPGQPPGPAQVSPRAGGAPPTTIVAGQKSNAKTTIDHVVNRDGTSTDRPPCKKNRDKDGDSWGTCHAFCTLCALDRLSAQHNFRTSANWVVFLSAVDRVCNPGIDSKTGKPQPIITSSQQLFGETLKGGDTRFDFNNAVKYGFCDEENYLPYSDKEPPQPRDHQTQQGLDAHKSGSPTAFANQFGIGFEDLQKLYCPNGPTGAAGLVKDDPGYETRLKNMSGNLGVSEAGKKFLKCANQSLDIAKKIKRGDGNLCQTKTQDYSASHPFDPKDIEAAIDRGIPVSIDITSAKAKAGVTHCVTATAYKDQKFDIINSHGDGTDFAFYSTDPIKFSGDDRGRKIVSYWYVDCNQPAGRSSAPPSEGQPNQSGHHGHGRRTQ